MSELKITASHLRRAAVVYVRQSTLAQVERNTESTARQYGLVTRAAKLLWLAICSIEDKRARDRAKEAGLGRGAKRKAEGHLVEGQTTTSWKQALAQLALVYPDRINPHL